MAAAHQEIVTVSSTDTVRKAATLMSARNFSQLAVVSANGICEKAVSWESIGKARLSGSDPQTVAEVATEVPSVALEAPLLEQIPTIFRHGFILVHSGSRKALKSIITTSDLTLRFGDIARPFLLTEEAERLLRRCVDKTFDLETIAKAVPKQKSQRVRSASDLTLGNYGYLLDMGEAWEKLGWDVDRETFLELLEEMREMRNDIMHFRRGPLKKEEIGKLENFVELMRKLAR
ncbi:CBS domain-containing protein [Nocardiopsis sp. NPDC055879]